ncbi:MAG: hypothetical protein VKO64_05210 [Candidatus Sericytochromatia bacterium]|nr:hypothetical protein [Candidatus Sericytochromatia bacterium]
MSIVSSPRSTMQKRLLLPLLPLAVACAANTTTGTGAVKGPEGQAAQDAVTRSLVAQPDPEGRWSGRVTVPSKIRAEAGLGVSANGSGALIANMAGSLVSNNAGLRRALATAPEATSSPATDEELPVASASVEVVLEDGKVAKGLTDDRGYYDIAIGAAKAVELRSRFQLGERPVSLTSLPFRSSAQPLSVATTLATAGFRKKFGNKAALDLGSLESFQQLTRDLEAQARQAHIDALRSFEQTTKAMEDIQQQNAAIIERLNAMNAALLQFEIPTPMPWAFDNWTPPPVPTMPPMPTAPPVPTMPPMPTAPPAPTMPPMPTAPPVPTMPPMPTAPPVPTMPPMPTPPSDF